MGVAQNSMLALIGTAGVAGSKMASNLGDSGDSQMSSILSQKQMDIQKDEEMAKYAREMRDAKLKTAKNNAKMSGLRLKELRAKLKGDK